MKAIEKEENSILEVLSIIQEVATSLRNIYDSKFLPFCVQNLIKKLRNKGEDKACNKFIESALSVYHAAEMYLTKWTKLLLEFQVFEWLNFKANHELDYEEVEKSVIFLKSKKVEIDDNKFFFRPSYES